MYLAWSGMLGKQSTSIYTPLKCVELSVDLRLQDLPHKGQPSKGELGHELFVRHLFKYEQ